MLDHDVGKALKRAPARSALLADATCARAGTLAVHEGRVRVRGMAVPQVGAFRMPSAGDGGPARN
ncbi:hypothetical protein [Streptomyces sp. AF1A]|jgi:hypothetical protein|uniref:hypothetical protein n=1 Tax=Streptomyces sp. AF1A TaxID=3394350 RepID=UPI0039BC6789